MKWGNREKVQWLSKCIQMTQSSAAVANVVIEVKLKMLLLPVNSNLEAKSISGFQSTPWEDEMSFLEQNVAIAVTDGAGWVLERMETLSDMVYSTEDL